MLHLKNNEVYFYSVDFCFSQRSRRNVYNVQVLTTASQGRAMVPSATPTGAGHSWNHIAVEVRPGFPKSPLLRNTSFPGTMCQSYVGSGS